MGEQTILFDRLVELMEKIREYLKVRGVFIDSDKEFNMNLDNWERNLERPEVWNLLKDKAGFGAGRFDNYFIRSKWLLSEPECDDIFYLRCRDGLFQVRKRNPIRVNLIWAKICIDLGC